MRKKIASILLTLLVFGTLLSGIDFSKKAQAAEIPQGSLSVTFHYYRYDNNYTNWNLWTWPSGAEGKRVDFDKTDDFGVAVTYTMSGFDGTEGVGFIIKKGEWSDREAGGDRYIPLSAFDESGHAEVWVVQADLNVYFDKNDADLEPKMLNAVFSDDKNVVVKITGEVKDSDLTTFTIKDELDANVAIKSVTKKAGSKSEAVIELSNSVSFSKSYFVDSTVYKGRFISMDLVFETKGYNDAFEYSGELGAIYSTTKTDFKLWSPAASKVKLNLFSAGSGDNLTKSVDMVKGDKGLWTHSESGDIDKTYYTYSVTNNGTTYEAVDPYAKATGVNGQRGMVINLAKTNPAGWDEQKRPITNQTDAIIYEAHIRDLSIDPSSGVSESNRGKFLGLTEKGTKNAHGQSTVLDHLIELGITELHILPMYDYYTIDESKPEVAQFNWGYDPQNYNVPEGSYSTDATKGEVRVNELKQMVMTLHNNGIRVVMDVVYNHTSKSADSDFEKIAPGYYYRKDANGGFSNGSGCGNETASERAMYRKFMLDSVLYWAKEYKIDGFRFDLMGLHDITTMNLIRSELTKLNPNTLIYGEGWDAGGSALAETKAAKLSNIKKVPEIAMFNDVIRDGLKGGVNDLTTAGYVQGKTNTVDKVKHGIVGGISHPQVTSPSSWKTNNPTQSINYASAHDNYTLFDKITGTTPTATVAARTQMNNLASAIVLTSQGIPFMHAGEEMLRSKPDGKGGFDENSYRSSDAVNSFKWNDKNTTTSVFNYYKGLIALRKAYPHFKMRDSLLVASNLNFVEGLDANMIGYSIEGLEGTTQKIYVFHNSKNEDLTVNIPNASYKVLVEGDKAGTESLREFTGSTVSVKAISTTVLVVENTTGGGGKGCKSNVNATNSIVFFSTVAVLGSALLLKRKKQLKIKI